MTQQDRQLKKVKLYRVLKVVFYCLGLPLFVMAVFLASIRFIGNDPFNGNTLLAQQLGMFYDVNKLFTSPALYGVWIAFAIWLVIAIVHIILAKTVKSRRVRALSVTAFTMVVMLGCLFGMDAALSAKVDKIAADAPATVTVQDYKTLLSYYRTISSYAHKKNLTENLIDQVEFLEKVYHVEWEGLDKTGVAGSIGNKPVTYGNIIADDGTVGIDISFKTINGQAELDYTGSNGNYTFKGDDKDSGEKSQIVRLAPAGNGTLTINNKTYSHYFAEERTYPSNGQTYSIYTWYCKDMESTSWREGDDNAQVKYRENGVYGQGLYAQNGLLSDGWVFSFENVLEILEDYYEAKEAIENGNPTYYGDDVYAKLYNEAYNRREAYYNNDADPWLKAFYNQEVLVLDTTGVTESEKRFSLTRGELDELVAKLGALLGDNSLFDYLFNYADDMIGGLGGEGGNLIGSLIEGIPFLGGGFGTFFEQLSEGLPLSVFGLDPATLEKVAVEILAPLTGKTYEYVDDLILNVSYKTTDSFGIKHDNLYLAVIRGVGEWRYVESGNPVPLTRTGKNSWTYTDGGEEFATTTTDGKTYDNYGAEVKYVISADSDPNNIYLDIDFNDELLEEEQVYDPATGEYITNYKYAFDFDTLSAFLNNGLNSLLEKYLGTSTVDTILNLITNTISILKPIEVKTEYGTQTYYGLSIIGIEIPIVKIVDGNFKVDLDINGILTNFVKTLYSYQSAIIKPVWEFYPDESYVNKTNPTYIAQQNYARYERALYTATVYGSMIGSTLIGDSLGTGAYASSLGLTDLASVQQLKVDLSYQRECFPLFAVRDMIALFAGVVIMFYFISFIAAQREEDYATGKLTVRNRKEKKDAKKHEAEIIAEFDANEQSATSDGTQVADGETETAAEEKSDEIASEEPKTDEIATDAVENPDTAANVDESVADEPVLDEVATGGNNEATEEPVATEPIADEPVSDEDATVESTEVADEPIIQEEPKGDVSEVPVDENSDEEVL